MKGTLKIEDLRLKWVNVSDIPTGWTIDVRDWGILRFQDHAGQRISSIRAEDVNQEYRLKLYRRIQELKAAGSPGSWTFHIPRSFAARIQDLVQGEFSSHIQVVEGPRLKITKLQDRLEIAQKIRIMSVDDSRTMQSLIAKSLAPSTALEVVAQVTDPMTVLEQVKTHDPDILTLDIHMPGKNGVEVLKDLLRVAPRPAVLVTSLSKEDGSLVFEGLSAGAFDYIQKPSHEELEQFRLTLESTLVAAYESRAKFSQGSPRLPRAPTSRLRRAPSRSAATEQEIILIGSSTGGTLALDEVLPRFGKDCPPVVIVQHIPAVFSRALADSLNRNCEIEVVEVEDGMPIVSGRAYIAPGGFQLALVRREGALVASVRDDAPVNRFKPSVDYMFRSASNAGALKISAALLTGMGRDGAQGLLELKNSGAWTITQDEASSVVYGMPRAAKELGADCEVLPLSEIAQGLLSGFAQLKS